MKKVCQFITRKGGARLLLSFCIGLLSSCGHRPELLDNSQARKPPRIRLSCYATPTVGTTYTERDNLGMHRYENSKSEKNGIIYTCKGGHVDIAHLRKGADWTAFLAEKTLENLRRNKAKFSFKLYEPSRYFVHVSYPENWRDLPSVEKERVTREISIGLGQYFSFVGCTWHEILTYLGYRPVVLYPEFPSAFSWEDSFSNLLGTHLAGMALRDTQREYDEAMTVMLDRELEHLGAQSKKTAARAAEQMRGRWFSGEFLFLITMRGRNFDIGLDDGFVTPWLVPSLEECRGAEPQDYPAPSLRFLADYGFSVKLEIEPREVEKSKILKLVYPDPKMRRKRIEPAVHFATIMDHIERDAQKRYGRGVGPERTTRGIESGYNVRGRRDDAIAEDSAAVSEAGNVR